MSPQEECKDALARAARDTYAEKTSHFLKQFENAEEVLLEFIYDPYLDQLRGQPSTTLALSFFIARAMGEHDMPIDKVMTEFINHQIRQDGVSNIKSNTDAFKAGLLNECDWGIQKLEPKIVH